MAIKLSMIKERVIQVVECKGIPKEEFYVRIGMTSASFRGSAKRTPLNSNAIENILSEIPDLNSDWLLTAKGDMLKADHKSKHIVSEFSSQETETRPRIPMYAAAGSLSVVSSSVTNNDCEQLPIIKAFPQYDFTIFVRGDSMFPEYHSGDEIACLFIKDTSFIQWGRVHVLDTAQGIIIKRIEDNSESILCRSINPNHKDFSVHKSEMFNIALVIGLVRRY